MQHSLRIRRSPIRNLPPGGPSRADCRQLDHVLTGDVSCKDEARIGQQGTLTRGLGQARLAASRARDRRYDWAYLFGAACPERRIAAGLVIAGTAFVLDEPATGADAHEITALRPRHGTSLPHQTARSFYCAAKLPHAKREVGSSDAVPVAGVAEQVNGR